MKSRIDRCLFYQQKSRVDWLRLGDSNTHFFFAAMKQRYTRNRMASICSEDGTLLTEPDQSG